MEELTGYKVYGKLFDNKEAAQRDENRLNKRISEEEKEAFKLRDFIKELNTLNLYGKITSINLNLSQRFFKEIYSWENTSYFEIARRLGLQYEVIDKLNSKARFSARFRLNEILTDEEIHEIIIKELTQFRENKMDSD